MATWAIALRSFGAQLSRAGRTGSWPTRKEVPIECSSFCGCQRVRHAWLQPRMPKQHSPAGASDASGLLLVRKRLKVMLAPARIPNVGARLL